MKAILLNEQGTTNQLIYSEIPVPSIKNDEVLIEVRAIGINPVDVKSRAGKGVYGRLKDQLPIVLGWDISGIVVEAGTDAGFKKGDEVFGMVNFPGHGKAYAEYVAAPAAHLTLKPATISHAEAAAATLAALTAYQALVHKVQVKPGDNVLIHAASGGVGHYAVQMARHLGAIVTGTSSARNRDFVLSLGAQEHIDYHGYDWTNSPLEFDFVFDTVGGDNIDHSIEVAKAGSMVISIPTGLNEAVTEKAAAKGVNGYFFLVSSNGADMKVIADWLGNGYIRSHVSAQFDFSEMAQAHLHVESGRTVGKVVVTL
ncbi:zinc-binding dehydrogenase [Flavobacterium rakeshii]|uniref:Zinc-binding dehydrogenase n=1 Tax=Flavobacterium rakeshii TaxID=1038845 RepID=A0A6N8HG68_9FLAO|nr:NADP-dependent oxidoreductase [Flavobacterium rakeshii]MUV04656.1 zinc-binding dehydrogenase [Flavobacterium rakeshii]